MMGQMVAAVSTGFLRNPVGIGELGFSITRFCLGIPMSTIRDIAQAIKKRTLIGVVFIAGLGFGIGYGQITPFCVILMPLRLRP